MISKYLKSTLPHCKKHYPKTPFPPSSKAVNSPFLTKQTREILAYQKISYLAQDSSLKFLIITSPPPKNKIFSIFILLQKRYQAGENPKKYPAGPCGYKI
jgi:hypothetical protein